MKLSCPACGAEVLFKSRVSIFGVCAFCNSTLVRHDLNLETLGMMAELAPDMSPLQMGTSGVFEGSRFEVVGRQKIAWENGSWSEWYVLFDSGKDGWLAYAQGFYMVSFQDLTGLRLPSVDQLTVDQVVSLGGFEYTVDDIKEVTCAGSQGELPFKSTKGRKSVSIDLSGPSQKFCSLDFSSDGDRAFFGKYVEFEELKLTNLREIDGW